MEEVTIGFKSGKAVTFKVDDTEGFMARIRKTIADDLRAVTYWYSEHKYVINVSAIEYVMQAESIIYTDGGL